MKTHLLINFINYINKFYKVFDKQILFYPLLDNLYKSSKKVRQISRINLRINKILVIKTTIIISKNN